MEPLHSPAEMRFLSSLGHWIEGGILGIVAIMALLETAVTWAARVHRYLGLLLNAGGAAKAAQVVWVAKAGWLAFAWPLLLLLSAVLLLAYREPKGAYESPSSQHAIGAHGH